MEEIGTVAVMEPDRKRGSLFTLASADEASHRILRCFSSSPIRHDVDFHLRVPLRPHILPVEFVQAPKSAGDPSVILLG